MYDIRGECELRNIDVARAIRGMLDELDPDP
jgi:hypothetical protein